MSDKMFGKIVAAVIILGIVATVALTLYTIYLHGNCSIIVYIANGG